MNLIEAIKSGRKFKRKSEPDKHWIEFLEGNDHGDDDGRPIIQNGGYANFWKDDLLADDWEIQESEVDKLKATIEELNIDIWSLKEQNKRLANDYQEMKQRELLRKR